jgi:hypothetical protein
MARDRGRHYSLPDFFRQMPNKLLARYFDERGVLAEVDSATLKEGKPEELFTAWLALPETSATPWMPSCARFTP